MLSRKDALDGVEFGQVSSSSRGSSGSHQLASSPKPPRRTVLTCCGTCARATGYAIVYEVSLRVKPIEALDLTLPAAARERIDSGGVRRSATRPRVLFLALDCRWTCRFSAPHAHRRRWQTRLAAGGCPPRTVELRRCRTWVTSSTSSSKSEARDNLQSLDFAAMNALYVALHMLGGDHHPGARQDHRLPDHSAVGTIRLHVLGIPARGVAGDSARVPGFCGRALRNDRISVQHAARGVLHSARQSSSTAVPRTRMTGDIFSIDPIHAKAPTTHGGTISCGSSTSSALARRGIPLLNQSPFVERQHVEAAYGERWQAFSQWVRSMDPEGRMLNPFFAELLSPQSGSRSS